MEGANYMKSFIKSVANIFHKGKGKKNDKDVEVKYLNNAPVYNDTYIDQASAIYNAINKKDINNIGIIAPYGSGKSSIIKTFKTEYPKHGKKMLDVTLANFKEAKKNEETHNGGLLNNDSIQKAEKSILEQLLYSTKRRKLPNSRVKRIRGITFSTILLSVFLVLTISLIVLSILEINKVLPDYTGQNFFWYFSFSALSLALLVFIIFTLFKRIKISYGNLEVDLEADSKESILNAFIDEIIYFFQRSGKKIVVFEDIDRFDCVKLLGKLREINGIINNNAYFKNKKVKFIYCVKDGLFYDPEERAKFFDFVVPMYPYITTESIEKSIQDTLNKEANYSNHHLSVQFINEISYFLKDKRVINCIVNDFMFYKKKSKVIDIDNEKLFAMMIYKNIHFDDFSLLQHGSGELYSFFTEHKKKAINAATSGLNDELADLKDKAKGIMDGDTNRRLKRLTQSITGIILRNGNISSSVPAGYINVDEFSSSTNSIKGVIVRVNDSYYPYKYFDLESINNAYGENVLDVRNKIIETNKEEIEKKINEINKKLSLIKNSSAKDILESFDSVYISKIKTECPFLYFAITKNYINETYFRYIGSIDNENDVEIVKNIISSIDVAKDTKINDIDSLIIKLPLNCFSTKYVYIYDLLESMLSSSKSNIKNKKEAFFNNLSSRNVESINFIADYYLDGRDIKVLIKQLSDRYNYILFDLLKSEKITPERKDELVISLLNDIELLAKLNVENVVKDYVEKHSNPIGDIFATFNSDEDVFDLIDKLSINQIHNMIHNNDSPFELALFEELVSDARFEINYDNLKLIYKDNINMSTPLNDKREKVRKYFNDNVAVLLNTLLNNAESIKDDEATVKTILTSDKIGSEQKVLYSKLISDSVPYVDGLDISVYTMCFEMHKYTKWEDLVALFKNASTKDLDFSKYVSSCHQIMSGSIKNKSFVLMLINSQIISDSPETLKSISKSVSSEISFQVSEINTDKALAAMISVDRVALDNNILNAVAKMDESLVALIKVHPEYISKFSDCTLIGKSELEALLLSNITDESKIQILNEYDKTVLSDKLSDKVIETVFKLLPDESLKASTELLSYLYGEYISKENNNSAEVVKKKGMNQLNGKELLQFIKVIDGHLYNKMTNLGNPINGIKFSKEYVDNSDIIPILEVKGMLKKRIYHNGVNYTITFSESALEWLKEIK